MKIIRETNRVSLRSSIAMLVAAIVILALSALPAEATPNPHKGFEAKDTCREIREVRIRSGWWIDSIQLVCANGRKPRRGGPGGGLHVFRLQPGEYITGMSGRHKGPAGHYVYSLQIHTNLRSSPIYGQAGRDRGRKAFRLDVPEGHFVAGISTRSGRYLEKIRLKTKKIPRPVTHSGVIDHGCHNIAEIRVRQTWWGSELEVICADGRHRLRNKRFGRAASYHPVAPGYYDGRRISRDRSGGTGTVVYRRQ